MIRRPRVTALLLVGLAALPLISASSNRAALPHIAPPLRSAPIANVRYDLTFDSATAQTRSLRVAMTFDVRGPGPVLLSLPAWTPGAYEITEFARWVLDFGATADGKPLAWDKTDPDTWRIQPNGARTVRVAFGYRADTLDNAMAWSRPDFLLVNGTNAFLYPEGRSADFPATVTVHTQSDWRVATGMRPTGAPNTYGEGNYHDLVDMPFFIGKFDFDSARVDGRWVRLATYPAGALTGDGRAALHQQMAKAIPAEIAVFGEDPWRDYTTMDIFEPSFGGGSALEHQSSHVGIYHPGLIGSPVLASITAHEIFHAWNVKRLRPADMMPYHYDAPQPTPLLWVSEGITDYYADLALVRGGVIDSAGFVEVTNGKIGEVDETPSVALEDASLSTWIHPVDGTGYLYYPKGSLAGFMLDILIRDASDNAHSLDDVMRTLYQTTYKKGAGFTAAEWWATASRLANGRSFAEFNAKYIDGREPYPWATILPLAGFRLATDTLREPRFGINSQTDNEGEHVMSVAPGGAGAAAGVAPGDILLSVGDVKVDGPDWGATFRQRYMDREGAAVPIVVRRGGSTVTLGGRVTLVARVETRLDFDPNASAKALRIRRGILTGR